MRLTRINATGISIVYHGLAKNSYDISEMLISLVEHLALNVIINMNDIFSLKALHEERSFPNGIFC